MSLNRANYEAKGRQVKAELSKLGYDNEKTNTILYKVLRAIGFRPKYGPYVTGWEAFGFSFALAAITFPLALVIADCMSFLNFNRKLLIVTDLVCGLATALVFAGVMARFTVKFKKDQRLADWNDLYDSTQRQRLSQPQLPQSGWFCI